MRIEAEHRGADLYIEVQYSAVQYCRVKYSTISNNNILCSIIVCIAKYSVVQCSIVLFNAAQRWHFCTPLKRYTQKTHQYTVLTCKNCTCGSHSSVGVRSVPVLDRNRGHCDSTSEIPGGIIVRIIGMWVQDQ